ncbi:MAG: hypothetical protein E6593_07290 [Clostridium sp.]|nr:hypothetical protein [Clostridium sp.]
MTYYVNLGGIILYGVQNVDDGKDREITAYDGIGQGNFPVPESPKLHTWTIECEMTEKNTDNLPNWSAASKVFTAFDVLLATKDPSRFIFVSDNRNESMSGYLAGYNKKEKYPGTYDVTIRVTEYKAAGVKTTDVPYIKRPGKAPAVPKTVVFNSKTTPYSEDQKLKKGGGGQASKGSGVGRGSGAGRTMPNTDGTGGAANRTGGSGFSGGGGGGSRSSILDKDTGKPATNPATLKDGAVYVYSASKAVSTRPTVKLATDAIGKAFSDFAERMKGDKSSGGSR